MRPLLVVDDEPRIGDRLQLRHRFGEMRVEHFSPIRAIKSFAHGSRGGLGIEMPTTMSKPSRLPSSITVNARDATRVVERFGHEIHRQV